MQTNFKTGFYGKLPSNGDFLSRNLSREIILNIDEWFQISLTQLRHRLPDWSYFFNASPGWVFLVPENFFSQNAYAGYIVPSMDRVGRCFPLIVLTEIETQKTLQVETLRTWYLNTQSIVRDCFQNLSSADELMAALSKIELPQDTFENELSGPTASSKNDIFDVLFSNATNSTEVFLTQSSSAHLPSPLSMSTSTASDFALPAEINVFSIHSDVSFWWRSNSNSMKVEITHQGPHTVALFTQLFVHQVFVQLI